ncbi:serine/threonine-protein kinase atg1-like, partial [Drosophila novamexicana]|uniref:serine/threonine-protein kinase atg1-like n=1 Tax=Drosophila novamexicana TaxID=47314 RepID=UPI0011E5D993
YYRKPQKYRNDEHPNNNNNNNNNNNSSSSNIKTNSANITTTATNQFQNNDNYLASNRCSSQASNSLDLVPVELQHYNNNYYYYYNYNLSYAPPPAAPHECLLGGPKGRLQQLKRRTRHELQQWPLLMQLVVLVLWLHGKFWQIVNEQILMHRRRWH